MKTTSQKLRKNLKYRETSKRDGASPRLGVSRYYILYKVYGGAGVLGSSDTPPQDSGMDTASLSDYEQPLPNCERDGGPIAPA